MSRFTLTRMCMCCDARISVTFDTRADEEERLIAVARAKGWIELPENARRRNPVDVCADCQDDLSRVRA